MERLRGRGIRHRLAAVTALCVTAAMVVGILAVALVLHQRLQAALASRVREQADTLSAVVSERGVGAMDYATTRELIEDARVQVQTLDHRLVYPTSATSLLPAGDPRLDEIQVTGTTAFPRPGDHNARAVVATARVKDGRSEYLVVVSRGSGAQHEAVASVVKTMLLGLPLLVLLTGVATWHLVGAALRPVEAIRRKTAQITALRMQDRVPVPAVHDEVRELALTMNAMLERLDTAAQSQRRFVSDASHELRSPLSTIRGATQLGQLHGMDEWFELLPMVEVEAGRLDRLITDLLTLSKSDDRGAIPLTVEDVDLDDLITAEAARLRTATGRTVTTSLTPVRLEGDPQLLGQVLRNLAENAARAATSRVELTARVAGDRVVAQVADDGPGIPPQDRERVFERFVRLDDARSRDRGGSGLGLAIVAEIVRAHGGSITVEQSDSLGGAAFVVNLPMNQTCQGNS